MNISGPAMDSASASVVSSNHPSSSSSTSSLGKQKEEGTGTEENLAEKMMIVRVRRKRTAEPVDTLWLELNEKPKKAKCLQLDSWISRLSLTDTQNSSSAEEEQGINKKLLFQHVKTVSTSDNENSILESVLKNDRKAGVVKEKYKEQREYKKKPKNKQENLLASARQVHENASKNARFQLVWRTRKRGVKSLHDDASNDFCKVYDVDRVDVEEESSTKVSSEEEKMLEKFMPLLQECLPSIAAEYESKLNFKDSNDEEYVYDVYTLGKDTNIEETSGADYPSVQVCEVDQLCWDDAESEYDSEDSNAENNPQNDYPEEDDDDPDVEDSDNEDDSDHEDDSDNEDDSDQEEKEENDDDDEDNEEFLKELQDLGDDEDFDLSDDDNKDEFRWAFQKRF